MDTQTQPAVTEAAVTEAAATSERRSLTDITWSAVGGRITPRTQLAWDASSDLAYLAAARMPHLDKRQVGILISAASSTLPVVLTWEQRFGHDRIERATYTVVVDEFIVPAVPMTPSLPGRVRVHYWGFAHDLFLSNVVSVETPTPIVEFRDAD